VMYGCTDSLAINYYAGANINDGSCIFFLFGCTDSLAVNYNPNVLIDDGTCIYPILGCTDSTAFNYDPTANTDDGTCTPFLYGCTDPLSANYYTAANSDDGSCLYPGCTDSTATNYNSTANLDNGTCTYASVSGCMDPLATNFNSLATVSDSSCVYPTVCTKPIPTGLYIDEIIHNRVRIHWDNMTDAVCLPKQYRIQYREVGSTSWSQKNAQDAGLCNFGLSTTSKMLTNLSSNTTYEYKMKAWYCNTTGASVWSTLDSFTTASECPNVINFTVSTPLTTRATFTWDTTASYSFVRIKMRVDSISNPVGSDWFTVGGFGVSFPALTKNKNGLTPGETYRGQARTWCNPLGGSYSSAAWTSLVWWTQPTSIREGNSLEDFLFDIFPNPNRGEFDVRVSNFENCKMQLYLYNVLSEKIKVIDIREYNSLYHFNLSYLPKGIYTIELKSFNTSQFRRVIIQ